MNKIAVITGAGKGLGFHLVKKCLDENYTVMAISRSISKDLQCLAENSDNRLKIFHVDVTDYESIICCRKQIEQDYRHIELLINNAGIWLDYERLKIEDPAFDLDLCFKEFDVNAMGTLRMIREFLPLIRHSESEIRAIVNLSSDCASYTPENPRTSEYAYCMSKACINIISNLVNNSLKDTDIKVFSVFPGWLQTDMGYAGPGNPQPDIPPAEAAKYILNLIKAPKKEYVFCDRFGNCLN